MRLRTLGKARGIPAAASIAMVLASAAPAIAADPPIPSPTPPPASREALLEERLQRMEAMNQKMAERFDAVIQRNQALEDRLKSVAGENQALSDKIDELTSRLTAPALDPRVGGFFNVQSAQPPDIQTDELSAPAQPETTNRPFSDLFGGVLLDDLDDQPPDIQTDEPMAEPSRIPLSPGAEEGDVVESGADDQPPDIRTDEPEPPAVERPTRTFFHEGFKFETQDGEFTLHFHNETQLDVRAYDQAASDPVDQTSFSIRRQRFYFNGRITRPIEYSVSVNKGLGSFDLLDAYLNFSYDPRFQFRVGRYRVPFTYDGYALSNQFLATPERSVFVLNYGYNRNFALMGHGELFDGRLDYAVAGVNGPRNSFYDKNSHKDVLAYLNFRPFYQSERLAFLKHLNVGGSAAYGIQDQAPLPTGFYTSLSASQSEGTIRTAPAFLELNNNVLERGAREMWELHANYFYKGLSLMSAWDKGFNDYGFVNSPAQVHLPTDGYYVLAAYLLTGEHVERRSFTVPLRPFDLRKGKRGPGAIEVVSRYSAFSVGDEVFTGGLADPNLWANRVYAIDTGANWYLNKFTRIYIGWQHSAFNRPVTYRPGGWQTTSDLFWLRFQIYF